MHGRSAGNLDRRQFIAGTLLIAGGVAAGATAWRGPQTHPELTVIDRRFAALRDPHYASGRSCAVFRRRDLLVAGFTLAAVEAA